MKEIVIKIDDELHETIIDPNKWLTPKRVNKLVGAVLHGTELPKGHTELIDTKKLIQSVARSADNMKDNGVAPVFDLHEITNLILSQDVLIDADKGEE